MKKLLSLIFSLAILQSALAQEVFIPHGKINFEKRVNMVRTLEDNKWLPDDYKDKMQKYQASNWSYTFTEERSLYKEAPKDPTANSMFFFGGSTPGQFYTDLANNSRVISKGISGVQYLLKDSIPKLDWKIQQEVRMIAGYECRKAVARFNDTVYVVAFYTDKILAKGGPEGFTGLPGMILGLAIPRYFTTWFATKVEVPQAASLDLAIPTKGEKTETEKDFNRMIDVYLRWNDEKIQPTPAQVRQRIYSLTL